LFFLKKKKQRVDDCIPLIETMTDIERKPRRPRACAVVIFEGDIVIDSIGPGAVIGVRGTSSKRQKKNELVIFRGNITGGTLPERATIGRDNHNEDKTSSKRRGNPLEKSPKQKKTKSSVGKLRKRVKAISL